MRIAFLALLAVSACYRAPLEPHACPCIDGFVCVDDVCVPAGENPDDNPDAGANPDVGPCPEQFLRADACIAVPPPTAELVAVCDDGNSAPDALNEELGGGGGQCLASSLRVRVASSTVTGTLTLQDDDITTIDIVLEGDVIYDVDVPEQCVIPGVGCLPSDGSGSCAANGDECRCTGVALSQDGSKTLQQAGETWFGERQYFACTDDDGRFLLREDGLGLGPILVFAAP